MGSKCEPRKTNRKLGGEEKYLTTSERIYSGDPQPQLIHYTSKVEDFK